MVRLNWLYGYSADRIGLHSYWFIARCNSPCRENRASMSKETPATPAPTTRKLCQMRSFQVSGFGCCDRSSPLSNFQYRPANPIRIIIGPIASPHIAISMPSSVRSSINASSAPTHNQLSVMLSGATPKSKRNRCRRKSLHKEMVLAPTVGILQFVQNDKMPVWNVRKPTTYCFCWNRRFSGAPLHERCASP